MSTSTPDKVDRSRLLDDPRLLERELMGLRLHELIAHLASRDNLPLQEQPAKITLENVLRDDEADVLERGLAVLPGSRLQMLLEQPYLLQELQETLLGRGGAYWDQVTASLEDGGG